jgi:hypothetical protein
MVVLFAAAALVQLNDPDPVQWVAIYTAAMALSLQAARRRRVPPAVPLALAAVALGWAFGIAIGSGALDYRHMFEAWEMKSVAVEEAREVVGLLIVAAWMVVLGIRAMRAPA